MKLSKLAEVWKGVEVTKANLDPAAGEAYRVIQCHDLAGTEIARRTSLRTVYLNASDDPGSLVVRVGDILVALASERVHVLLSDKRIDWCIPHLHVALVRAPSSESRTRLFEYLSSASAQALLTGMKRGVIVRRVFVNDLRGFEVP